ncbi:M13-type metalloendopeptidase [Butyrivibrio sp. INlla16]|uniref:M13-type metalloendopeptidase n=1 Tax=Butyrivibrio sp. INlla16 TaxID=1520807 RepID=UPI00087EEC66|nr:M13-type metalloendopeptidase [Butyrivibrio sp. INlla16]SDB40668.1 Predicted metalloendopeptidase [Butyrivibrio sp. INlla16]
MKRMTNCRTKRVVACLVTAALSVSIAAQVTGCAASVSNKATQPEEIIESENETTSPAENKDEIEIEEKNNSREPADTGETSELQDNKNNESAKESQRESVYDFDDLVNAQWKEEAKAKLEENGYSYYSVITERTEVLDDKMVEIFKTDISSLPEDSDFYKVLYVYNQILDAKWEGTDAKKEIKSILDLIDAAGNRDDLYALFTDKYWGRYNLGMSRRVDFIKGDITNNIDPQTVNGTGRLTDEQKTAVEKYLIDLGFSEDRAKQIISNTDEMDKLVVDYHDGLSGDTLVGFIGRKTLEEKNVQFPILDILSKQDALGRDKDFYSCMDYMSFLDEFYTDENIPKIRDQMLACAAVELSRLDKEDGGVTFFELYPYAKAPDFETCLRYAIFQAGGYTIEKTFKEKYVDDKTIDNVKEMIEDEKTTMRSIIADTDWLSVHGKEQANHKIFYLKEYIGENGHTDDLSDVELSENPLANYIALKTSMYDFRDKQLLTDKTDKELFGASFIQVNAFYNMYNNSIIVADGYLEDASDYSYEETLAFLGVTLAHELSHAYDPMGSSFDYEGYYDPWMSEEEYEEYSNRTKKIEEFFDGMEVGDGIKLDGKLVCQEAFADLMGMECCLRILGERDNPDYDAFFKAYARENACYYTQDGLKEAVKDTHLPYKERINYIVGQFDEFYETYDVDPDSPYYVPKEKRLSTF